MKNHYDFSKGKRGRFYRADARSTLPKDRGTTDIQFESQVDPEDALKQVFFFVTKVWPNAVVEDFNTRRLLTTPPPLDAFAKLTEVVIYRDDSTREAWQKNRVPPSNTSTLIHVTVSAARVRFSIDGQVERGIYLAIKAMEVFLKGGVSMIRGYDLVYAFRIPLEEVAELIQDLVRRLIWPSAIVKKDSVEPHDFFIYADEKAKKAWGEKGLTHKYGNRMWHFLFSPQQMTWVCNSIEDADAVKFSEILESFLHPATAGKCFFLVGEVAPPTPAK